MSQAPLTAEELEYYDINAPLLGFMGAALALIFSNLGAAYGTGKSGMGISALGVGKPDLVMKSIVPVRPLPARVTACASVKPLFAPGRWQCGSRAACGTSNDGRESAWSCP